MSYLFISWFILHLLHKTSMRMWKDIVPFLFLFFYRGKAMKKTQEKFQRYSGNSTRNELFSFSMLNPRVSKDFVNTKQ